ncbi:MAG: hypothetical protein ACOX8B_04545 [Lachnospiraceae bacterium]|jgi:hypothetical protein
MNKNRVNAKLLAAVLSAAMVSASPAGVLASEETEAESTEESSESQTESSAVTIDSSRVTEGTVSDTSADGIVISDSESGHEAVIVLDSDYTISGADITLDTDADGTDTCDFSGTGTAVAVYGDSNVTIEDSTIETTGVATMPVFADDGATVTIQNSTLISNGGTLSADYLNTPDQSLMVAPPWILGIMGTSRCTNLMGSNTTMNVFDSDTSAGAWAVLSTDSGSNMYLNVYNTVLTLLNADESAAIAIQADGGQITTLDNPYTVNYGSGYGTYAIGNAVETFAGSTINAGTYATILTGGSVLFTSLEEGETYEVEQADGTTVEYTADATQNSVINSDTFGFMAHQDTNSITLQNGTSVNSVYATFLVKTGSSNEQLTVSVDDTEIQNGGVLIQLMDNDDATNGGMMSTDDEENTNGGSQNFRAVHTENEGFNTSEASQGSETQDFTFTNGTYTGNMYNASGSDNSTEGSLDGSALNVTLGSGAELSGGAASTAAIHVTYDGSVYVKDVLGGRALTGEDDSEYETVLGYQNTSFPISQYYDIGQVANMINYNGANDINMTVEDGAVWNVTEDSLISSLTIEDGGEVIVPEGVTLTLTDGTVLADGSAEVTLASGTYGSTGTDDTQVSTDNGTGTAEESSDSESETAVSADSESETADSADAESETAESADSASDSTSDTADSESETDSSAADESAAQSDGSAAPEMPGGEMPSGEMAEGEMPSGEMEMPSGEMAEGSTPPDMSSGGMADGSMGQSGSGDGTASSSGLVLGSFTAGGTEDYIYNTAVLIYDGTSVTDSEEAAELLADLASSDTQASADEAGSMAQGGPGDGSTPPEMPSGEMAEGEMPSGEMEMPSGEMAEGSTPPDMPDGEMPSGDSAGSSGSGESSVANAQSSAPDTAGIYIANGSEDTSSETDAGAYSGSISTEDDVTVIKNVEITSGDYTYTALAVAGDTSNVRLEDSVIDLTVDEAASDDDEGGAAVAAADGATLSISNSDLTVDGAGRYVTSVYDDSTLIVNDSTVTSTGSNDNTSEVSEPESNSKLLISGTARANFSVGSSSTYYFNSVVTAEGWGALSTDSASGDGLDLYAYNTEAIALDGGYGTYADTDCRVWLYGITISSAEVGAIISKTGEITIDSGDAASEELLALNEGETTSAESTITAGRNAVVIHAPDMSGQGAAAASTGVLSVSNSSLITTDDLETTEDYESKYGEAVSAYLDYVDGADILVKSTSADITLDNVTMESSSGVLVMSAINSDSMGNFLSEGDADQVDPISVSMTDMSVEGDILHMDYQRYMTVTLTDTDWTGALVSGTFEDWQELWSDYADDDSVSFLPDDSWDSVYGASVVLNGDSVWTVDGDSVISSLTLNDSASVTIKAGVSLTLTDGTVLADGTQTEDVTLDAAALAELL